MSNDDLLFDLGRVRELGQGYLSGTPEAFESARTLLNLLLHRTIVPAWETLRYSHIPGQPDNVRVIGVPKRALRLVNGHYMSVVITLQMDRADNMIKMRVYKARFQYQLDREGEQWVFRYDYIRRPGDQHPASHVNIRGELSETCLPDHCELKDVHFPTSRMSIEAVIRCLIEQFGVGPPTTPTEYWRRLLAESEAEFNRIAHRPLSGPSE